MGIKKKQLDMSHDIIHIKGIKVTIGCVCGEAFVGWYDAEKNPHFLEDRNIFRLKDKVIETFRLKEDLHLETELVINFLYKVMHMHFLSDLHSERKKEIIYNYLKSLMESKSDEKKFEKIRKYIDKIEENSGTKGERKNLETPKGGD